jgi:hypothetical protein
MNRDDMNFCPVCGSRLRTHSIDPRVVVLACSEHVFEVAVADSRGGSTDQITRKL